MYCDLPKIEIWTYFVLWCCGVLYSQYNVYLSGNYVRGGTFAPGWSLLGHKKDASDYEWAIWAPFIWSSVPWLCIHLVGAEVVRYACKELLGLWYLTVSLLYLLLSVGALATVFMMLEPLLMYGLLQFRRRSVLFVAGLVMLVLQNIDYRVSWMPVSYDKQYMLMISSAWIYMRSQSFCQDKLTSGKVDGSLSELITLLGYCFYFPMLFLGPLVIFEDFETGMVKPYAPWTVERLKRFAFNMVRYCWWAFVLEVITHVLYVSAIHSNVKNLEHLGAWAHYGLGFGMGMMFHLKYVASYGISCTIAQAEQIQTPHHPKCIARIHLYSDMWRHFDQGLYFFLRKYIYLPVLGQSTSLLRKLFASFICFVYIYAWHRVYLFVLTWTILNFVGVTLETFARSLGSTTFYQNLEKKLLKTPQNVRRCHAFLATPLLIMSAISNFYFFAGMSIGNHYIKRLTKGNLLEVTCLYLFCYCLSQVSIEVKNWEQQRSLKQA